MDTTTTTPATTTDNVAAPAIVAAPAKVYESDKLTALKAQQKEQWSKARAFEDPTDPAALAANLDLFKTNKLIEDEIKALKTAEAEAAAAEIKNARLRLVDELLAAYDADKVAAADKKLSIDEKNAVNATFKAAKDVVTTELMRALGTRAAAPKATTGDAKPTGERGATGQAIIALWLANRAAGMNDTDNRKAIIEAGHSRGTTGAVTLAWQKENGEK